MVLQGALIDKHMSAVKPKYRLTTHIKSTNLDFMSVSLMTILLSVWLAGRCLSFEVLTRGRSIWIDLAGHNIGCFRSVRWCWAGSTYLLDASLALLWSRS
jgi:hypothetical protein